MERSPAKTLAGILLASLFVLIWVLSIYLAANSNILEKNASELATIIFGATSVALILFSIFIAVAAVLGWQGIQNDVRETAKKIAQAEVKPLQDELRGRVLSVLGYTLGEMSMARGSLVPQDKERLDEAVRLCQQGYNYLKEVGGPAELMGLNNLVFYSALQGDLSRSEFLLKSARRLRDAGQERNAPHLQLTACRVILQFGDSEEKSKARQVLMDLASKSGIPEQQRKEASLHLASFPAAERPSSLKSNPTQSSEI